MTRKSGLVEGVELALDWGLPLPDEIVEEYETEIRRKEQCESDCEGVS